MNKTRKHLQNWVVGSLAILLGIAGFAISSPQYASAAEDTTVAPPPPRADAPPPPRTDASPPPPEGVQGPPRGEGMRGERLGPPHMMDPAKLFDQIDANSDGTVTKDEFVTFHAKRRPPHGPGEGPGRPGDGQGPGMKGDMRPPRREGWDGQNDRQGPPPRDGAVGPGPDRLGPPPRGEGDRGPRPGIDGPQGWRGGQGGEWGPPPVGPMGNRRGGPPMDPDTLFKSMDADHNGSVSNDEFKAFHASHRPPQGPDGNRPDRGGPPDHLGPPDGPRGEQQ